MYIFRIRRTERGTKSDTTYQFSLQEHFFCPFFGSLFSDHKHVIQPFSFDFNFPACIACNTMTPHTCFWRHFVAKILPSRSSHGDLLEWRRFSFFCCLLEIVAIDFQDAAILSSVCRSLLSLKTKKWAET